MVNKYHVMRSTGTTPHQVYRQAVADGLTPGACIRVLREVFGMDPRQAKEVMLQAEGAGSLAEHEERIAEQLQQAVEQGLFDE
jgi:ATP-dependent Clp protease adapter protein ClpS